MEWGRGMSFEAFTERDNMVDRATVAANNRFTTWLASRLFLLDVRLNATSIGSSHQETTQKHSTLCAPAKREDLISSLEPVPRD